MTSEEEIFATMVLVHLNSVFRATKDELFVTIEGLRRDVASFFALPIPSTVWRNSKIFQDADFVNFVEDCLEHIQS